MEEKQKLSKLAVASLIFGILGIISQTSAWIAIILAETFRYNNKKREMPLRGKAIAWWGFGLGVLFALSRIVLIILKHYAK